MSHQGLPGSGTVLPNLLGAGGVCLACLLGLIPTLNVLLGGPSESASLGWDTSHGAFRVGLDPLSAFFLLPILGLSALAAVYGGNYLLVYRDRKSLGSFWLFFSLFVVGMAFVVIARTAVLFLIAWEVMSLSAYFLVTFEHEKQEVRRAGWIYLIATHLGVAFLIAMFALLGAKADNLDFDAFQRISAPDPRWAGWVFVLALIGFGTKAGFVPFHVWLPEAHPAAPSHVSALMSGVMIKMGIYGLLRVLTFLGEPDLWWGPTLAGIGLATGLIGIALAVYQRDVKRVLAYSSIENMGLIALAIGVSLWCRAKGNHLPVIAALAMTGALLHVWNHSLMKGLMFFAAGSVLHGSGTKDMEKLGGLMKRMPWTGSAMMVGAVAIAALPPLNAFVSKWLMYLSLIRCGIETSDGRSLMALFAVGLLALIGGLAAIAFVRLTGIVLLGSPRSEAAEHAHESSPWMLGPMAILVLLCLVAAAVPQTLVVVMRPVLHSVSGPIEDLSAFVPDLSVKLDKYKVTPVITPIVKEQEDPLGFIRLNLDDGGPTPAEALLATVGSFNMGLLITLGATSLFILGWMRRTGLQSSGPTWGCGYAKPTARMQYTGRSFAETLAEHLLPRFFRPRTSRRLPHGLFPATGEFHTACPDPINEKIYEPFFRRWAERLSALRFLQQGKVQAYLFYIALTVVLGLAWVSIRRWWNT